MAIPRQLVEDAPNPALEESAQIDEAASGSPQPTPEDILGTPNLEIEGNSLTNQGLGMQKNVMDSGPTDALLTGLNNQGKINAVGQAGAMQFSDRKYDNAASQKIYDDLNAQRSTQSANRQKTADSLLSKGLGLKKESRDIASDSIRSKLDKSKLKVQESTEQNQIDKSQQELDNMYEEAARKGVEHTPVTPAVASAMSKRFGEPLETYAGKTPYEIKMIRDGKSAAERAEAAKLAGDKVDVAKDRNNIMRDKVDAQDERRKMLSDPQEKEIRKFDDKVNLANELLTELPSIKTGKVASARNAAGQLVNLDDPKVSAFKAKLGEQLAGYIHEMSGAATSNTEREFLKSNTPNFEDSPALLKTKLENLVKHASKKREEAIDGFTKQGKNTSAYKDTKTSTTNSDFVTVDDGTGPQRIPRKNLKAAQTKHPTLKVVGE